jgi:RNA polymerase sigma-70 factor (sigma-E family)
VESEVITAARVRALLGFAGALVGDRGLAEDLVQDVLLRLHTRRDRLTEVTDLDAYARRMIVNAYLSWGRRWFRVVPSPTLRERVGVPDPAQAIVDRDVLRGELRALPRRQRAVLVLRYYLGLSDADIAAELGCGVGTVRSHASRGLARLRVHMSEAPEPRSEPVR